MNPKQAEGSKKIKGIQKNEKKTPPQKKRILEKIDEIDKTLGRLTKRRNTLLT